MPEKICEECQKPFMTPRRVHRFCSNRCRTVGYNRRQKEAYPASATMMEERDCSHCLRTFKPNAPNQKLCSKNCRTMFWRGQHDGISDTKLSTGTLGAITELMIATDLMKHGWAVFRALAPTCFCDLVAFKDGRQRYIEVRTGAINTAGELIYPRKIATGATEYAVWARNTGEIRYIDVND